MKLHKIILGFCAVAILTACGSSDSPTSKDDCVGGQPQAIFTPQMQNIKNHSFAPDGELASIETFLLLDSIQVNIEQSGCTELEQVYTFEFATDGELVPQQGVMLLASCMTQLGLVDESTRPLAEIWGPLLVNYQDALASGEQVNLSPIESMQFRYAVGAELTMLQLTAKQIPQ